MRLGAHCYTAGNVEKLEPLCETLDKHGLSAIALPYGFWEWDDDTCIAYGEKARELGIIVGEAGFWENMIDPDEEALARRIETVRTMLKKADLIGMGCVVTLVGSRSADGAALGVSAFNFSDECKAAYREVCLRIVDGLDLKKARYCTEPWFTCFYHDPDTIREFLDSVGDPRVGLHLDQMNMVSYDNFFDTTSLIERTFELLRDQVASVHAKDIAWDTGHLGLKWDEVYVGDGVMDYDTYLKNLDTLDPDIPVFTEHFRSEEEFAIAIQRLHQAADKAGVRFLRRGESSTDPDV
jgi:sugar phosphate isomerase/epimerase